MLLRLNLVGGLENKWVVAYCTHWAYLLELLGQPGRAGHILLATWKRSMGLGAGQSQRRRRYGTATGQCPGVRGRKEENEGSPVAWAVV
jgi:hypothetical protein